MTDKIVVLTSCDSELHAKELARHLVEKRLAACVNISSPSTSIYRWKDKVEEATEWKLLIKSRRDLFDALAAEIVKLHTYEVPEVIALPVVAGSEAYLAWLDKEVDLSATV